nr:hypothetical protein [Candidatus Goldiibacteriota bacterium]
EKLLAIGGCEHIVKADLTRTTVKVIENCKKCHRFSYSGLMELSGITAEWNGSEFVNVITKRKENKGIYVPGSSVKGYDFFEVVLRDDMKRHLMGEFFCVTENVKKWAEKNAFNNLIFLEIGEIVEGI